MLEFDACVWGGEVPIGFGVVGIAVVLPGGDFVDEDLFVGNTAIDGRPRSGANLGCNRSHIATVAMLM